MSLPLVSHSRIRSRFRVPAQENPRPAKATFLHSLFFACLSLFVLSLLTAQPVRAQYPGGGYPGSGSGGGYPGGGGDHWQITLEDSGTGSSNDGRYPKTYPWAVPAAGATSVDYGTGPPQSGDFSNEGNFTLTFTWISQTGAQPPEGLYAKITSKAFAYCGNWSGTGPVGTGDADNGFGDGPIAGFTGPGAASVGIKVKDIGWTTSNHLISYKVLFSPKAHVYGTTYGTTEITVSAEVSSSPN